MSHHCSAASKRPPSPGLVCGSAPLDVAEGALRLLTTGPSPLSVDGRRLGHGLPRRPIPLGELSSVLMHPSTSFAARDAAWRLLVGRARTAGPAWVVGAVGVALPGLRMAASRLARVSGGGDAQAELLAGFVDALGRVDLDAPRVCPRLCNAAYIAARAALRVTEAAAAGEPAGGSGSAVPPRPWGHQDLVLARAVSLQVITAEEAGLIGVTRLEETTVSEYADAAGESTWAVYKRRARAEARLVAAIRDGRLSDLDSDVIAEATLTTVVDDQSRGSRR